MNPGGLRIGEVIGHRSSLDNNTLILYRYIENMLFKYNMESMEYIHDYYFTYIIIYIYIYIILYYICKIIYIYVYILI